MRNGRCLDQFVRGLEGEKLEDQGKGGLKQRHLDVIHGSSHRCGDLCTTG